MKRINPSFSSIQERKKKEENSYEYGEGIMKKLLEKYKPSESVKVSNIDSKRQNEQRAA